MRVKEKDEEENGKVQLPLDDFVGTNPNTLTPKEQKRKTKRHIIAKAKQHQKMFFELVLKSMDKNSISWQRVSGLIMRVLAELENEGICYLKSVPKGKARLFKRFYCRKTLDDWKECPDYFCPIWRHKTSSECPYDQE